MKKNTTLLLLALFLTGCGLTPYVVRDYEINKTLEATVGSTMMAWETGTKRGTAIHEGLRRELSYSGIDQQTIQISYREYYVDVVGAFARQAFYQDLKYDLSKSKSITFRDIRIRVDAADIEKIVFTILREPSTVAKAPLQNISTGSTAAGGVSLFMDKDFKLYEKPVHADVVFTNGETITTYFLGEDFISYAAQDSLEKSSPYRIMKKKINYWNNAK